MEGTVLLAVGLPLWLFADGIETPVVTLTKAGLVLAVIGAVTLLGAAWSAVRNPGAAGRP
ncbi:hypothetical protein GCM10009801_22620 [Streptomyces albiaxialis]|uniref:Uncharacterized protein n=1 Tax=Streptomyces albiaxialis TaxID=329523 RepID=A0ABP5HGN6_9ACTN